MGLFRKGKKPSDSYPDPPGVTVPEGMVAVPDEEMFKWAAALCDEAAELGVTEPAPNYIDLMAKISFAILADPDIKRPEASFAAYNLFLHGYWGRVVELRSVDMPEGSADARGLLIGGYERDGQDPDWFRTLQKIGSIMALNDATATPMADMPQGLGLGFRRIYERTMVFTLLPALEEQYPGVSGLMTEEEQIACWRLGYWVRALAMSLPDEGLAEVESL